MYVRYSGGVLFKLDTASQYKVLHSFTGGADGGQPNAVIRDPAGNLYGTTYAGGLTGGCGASPGCGVVFKLDPAGRAKVLYSFTGGTDGGNPGAGVIRDSAGNLYGSTSGGGDHTAPCTYGCGVVFKLDPAGQETVLYSFTDGADGGFPQAGVIRDSTGNLYGTTYYGGSAGGFSGGGVVYKVEPAGQETVLYTFPARP